MVNHTPEEILVRSGFPYQVFVHHSNPASLREAARERNQQPSQVIKTILFRVRKNSFLVVLISGDRQVSWKKLRLAVDSPRLTTASENEVFSITGCRPGTVSPFSIPANVPIYVDSSVLHNKAVSIGSGTPGKAFILNTTDLIKALNDPDILNLSNNDDE